MLLTSEFTRIRYRRCAAEDAEVTSSRSLDDLEPSPYGNMGYLTRDEFLKARDQEVALRGYSGPYQYYSPQVEEFKTTHPDWQEYRWEGKVRFYPPGVKLPIYKPVPIPAPVRLIKKRPWFFRLKS